MLPKRIQGYWILFYQHDLNAIREHFALGGTLSQLESQTNQPGNTPLSWSINDFYNNTEPLLLVLNHGAVPHEHDWDNAIVFDRCNHIEVLLEHGFVPPKSMLVPDNSGRAMKTIKKFMCRRAVIAVLLIASRHRQPLFHMWKIIARKVWDTKLFNDWLII